LSEIILQQTRVAQGLSYYERFVEKFPKVEVLALATEQTVLNEWQGLGYYSRARNLHYTANFVMCHYNSQFPSSYEELIKLKGIGDYTASAISSFSSKEVRPVLDGNVYRFISRLYGIETPINTPKSIKEFKIVLNELIDVENPDLFNQSIIEYGALFCVPKSPQCQECVFRDSCYAFSKQRVDQFPVKLKKKKSEERFLNFIAVRKNEGYYLVKREGNAIWKNLYEFPNIESRDLFEDERGEDLTKLNVTIEKVGKTMKHILSHQKIHAKLFVCVPNANFSAQNSWNWVSKDDFKNYPIHRLMEKMIEAELSEKLSF
jgi:A/G-specific adenine glycosylase